MNEQLQLTINDILTQSMEAFNQGADFLAGEIPQVVEQLLTWHFTMSAIWFGIALFTTASLAYANLKTWKWMLSEDGDGELFAPAVFFSLFSVTGSAIFIAGNLDWLKIWIAPKLYLLESAAELIK